MALDSQSHADDPEQREERIRKVIEGALRARRSGSGLDFAEVESNHPELMPELGEGLRAARRLEQVAQPAAASGMESEEKGFACDLSVMSRELTDYDFVERLQYGGQGVVYRAVHRPTKRSVAVKVMLHGPFSSDRERQRFLREIELISRFHHSNIVTLYDAGVVQGRPYYVMEYVDGLPINDFVLLNDLNTREVVALFLVVCRAVSGAHQRGVIHRDLKPSNILVDESGQPHILDFGFAKEVSRGPVDDVSLTGQVIGTVPYMSPEQAAGEMDQVDVRTDIYSLGVVLYELLTDALPYPIDGGMERVRARILHDEPIRLRQSIPRARSGRPSAASAIDDDLENIVHKALAKDKQRRYQSADAFADDLKRYLAGDAVAARGDSGFYLVRKTLRRYRVHASVAAAFVVLLTVFAATASVLYVQAKTQRDQAERVARVAHGTLDDVLKAIDEDIQPLPGGRRARLNLNMGVQDRLDELRTLLESGVGLELDDLLAAVYRNKGDILRESGHGDEAAESYRRFLALSQQLLDAEPANPLYLDLVSSAHGRLAEVASDYEPHYLRAIELERQVLSLGRAELEAEFALCSLHAAFGRRLTLDQRYAAASEQFDAALTVAEPLTEADDRPPKWTGLMATVYARQGKNKLQLGAREEALVCFRRAIDLRQELLQSNQANAQLRFDIMESYLNMGDAYRYTKDAKQAMPYFQRAAKVGRILVGMDPAEMLWARRLFAAVCMLAQEHVHAGDLEAAGRDAEEAFAVAEKLVAADGENPEWQEALAMAHGLRGQLSRANKAWEQGRDHYLIAANIFETVLDIHPGRPATRSELANAYGSLAKCYGKLGEENKEHACLLKAYRLRSELWAEDPSVPGRRLALLISQVNLSAWHINRRIEQDDGQALPLLLEAAKHLKCLRDAGHIDVDGEPYKNYESAIHKNLGILERRGVIAPAADDILANARHADSSP